MDPSSPLSLRRGPIWKNRFVLAPLTNTQSHEDGSLSDDEHRWLTMRAEGGFAVTMTCASHVMKSGQGFPGQLGVYDDALLPGLTRLAADIRAAGSVGVVQLHHGGMRAKRELTGEQPICPSEVAEHGARAMLPEEIPEVVAAFVAAAVRAERAGFDGVELHAAHGYLLCQFLSPELNQRTDAYGGSVENRSRILFEILHGVRSACREGFQLGVRISPERFGLKLDEVVEVARRLLASPELDILDLSLWDTFKDPHDEAFRGRSLLSFFTDLPRGDVRVGAAGNLRTGADVRRALDEGCDFAILGRAAILHHDFPQKVAAHPDFSCAPLPASAAHLHDEGLGPAFVQYMRNWKGFVAD